MKSARQKIIDLLMRDGFVKTSELQSSLGYLSKRYDEILINLKRRNFDQDVWRSHLASNSRYM